MSSPRQGVSHAHDILHIIVITTRGPHCMALVLMLAASATSEWRLSTCLIISNSLTRTALSSFIPLSSLSFHHPCNNALPPLHLSLPPSLFPLSSPSLIFPLLPLHTSALLSSFLGLVCFHICPIRINLCITRFRPFTPLVY